MKRLFLGVAIAALVAGPALAADIVIPATQPPPPPPPPPPVFSWTGPYGGPLVGYGWGQFSNGVVASTPGAVAGAFLGFNWQRDSIVLGTEADFMWSNRADGLGNAVNWTTSVRARLGVGLGSVHVYGTGGVAIAGVTTTAPSASTEIGWTAGAGVEAGTDVVFGRLEYLYANYGTLAGAGTTVLSTHEVRAGIGIRF